MQQQGSSLPSGLAHLLALLFAKRIVVSGWSMTPTLLPGEHVLVNRLAYRRNLPAPGEVVLVVDPRDSRTLFVKRVLACPGDTVEITSEGLLVNGTLAYDLGPSDANQPQTTQTAWNLRADEYFLVGDAADIHSAMSTDSRTFGPVPRKLIRGRVWMVYWPPPHVRRGT